MCVGPESAKIHNVTAKAFFALALAACSYDTHFEDCAVRCAADASCPADLACGTEGFCRTPGATEACAADPVCTDYTLELAAALSVSEQAVATLPASNLPGEVLTVQRACLHFSTEIPASARSFSIGQQQFEAGPCDSTAPQETNSCFDYVRPEVDDVVRVDNTSPATGCQNGTMTDVQLVFPCP